MRSSPSRLRSLAAPSILLLLAVGIYLRVWELGDQVVLGDEWHSVEATARHDPLYIVSSFHARGYSIPLVIWNWCLQHTIGLEEWGLRLPVLIFGMLLIPVCGLVAWRIFGALEGLFVAALVTLSPMAVLYSRFARPYVFVAFASILATWGWLRWREQRRRGWGIVSAVSGSLAIYLHLYAAPAIFALWGGGLLCEIREARRASDGRSRSGTIARLRGSLLLVGGGLALLALLLAPTLPSTLEVIGEKVRSAEVSAATWWGALQFLAGTRSHALTVVWIALVLAGTLVGWRRARWLTLTVLAMTAVQVAAVQVTAPTLGEWPFVVGRYLVPVLPGLLLLAGLGFTSVLRILAGAIDRRPDGTHRGSLSLLLAGGVLLSLFAAAGPLADAYRPHNSFTLHPGYYASPSFRIDERRLPSFYRFLAQCPPGLHVAEAPLNRAWFFTLLHRYQNVHRHVVRGVTADPTFLQAGMRFRSILAVDQHGLHGAIPDYVIIHGRLFEEIVALSSTPHRIRDLRLGSGSQKRALTRKTVELTEAACRMDERLLACYEDEWLRVYANGRENLERVRDWLEGRPRAGP
jgi:hypothetical protein